MVEFTSLYVLFYRSTCRAHLESDFAQIWCASILVVYLGISEKTLVWKMGRNVFPENALSLRFHVLSFPWPGIHNRSVGMSELLLSELTYDWLPTVYKQKMKQRGYVWKYHVEFDNLYICMCLLDIHTQNI
jgi:hypothetical protein